MYFNIKKEKKRISGVKIKKLFHFEGVLTPEILFFFI